MFSLLGRQVIAPSLASTARRTGRHLQVIDDQRVVVTGRSQT